MKNFRYVGYFLSGMVWFFFGGIPVLPLGIFSLAGAFKDAHKAIASGLVVLGILLGFFGTGIYLKITPEGKMSSYSISPSISLNFNVVQSYRHNLTFLLSGSTTEGRIVADDGVKCIEKNDAACFADLVDESFLGVTKQAVVNEVNGIVAATGALSGMRLADIRYLKMKAKNAEVFQFVYVLKSEKVGDVAILLGANKQGHSWRLVSLSATSSKKP